MNTVPSPDELKRKTSPSELFRKTCEIEIAGTKFRLRRMSLAEELEWYGEREKIFADSSLSQTEKVVKIWENLLHRVVEEPVMHNYVEELPAPVIAALIQAVTELHFWNMDFRRSPQA